MFRSIAIVIVTCFFSISYGQKVNVQNYVISDEGIVRMTCLIEAHHSQREEYELKVFSSADDFKTPLDLNIPKLMPGVPAPIEFDGNEVIGEFDGLISFDLQITAVVFPVEVRLDGSKFKRGKSITISWDDFHESGWYDVEIYKDDILFQKVVGNHRGTSYTTKLPKKMSKGEYEVRVTPTKQPELVSEDYAMVVKSGKAPLIIGLGAAAAAGGGVFLIGGGEPGGAPDNNFPEPPALPGN